MIKSRLEQLLRLIVAMLPRHFIMLCAVRLMAHSTKVHPQRTPSEISILMALNDWEIRQ